MTALELRYEAGAVHLPGLGLWLDARRRQPGPERVFVSHAHSDHIAAHREVIVSAPTARFLGARLKGQREEHILPFGAPARFAGAPHSYQVTLLAAGHILGSAMAFLEAGDRSLLYTGDFKLHAGLAAEPCAPRHADILVMETTFGRPQFHFPPAAATWEEILGFCRRTLAEGGTPVLLGYPLGKSQALIRGVAAAGLPVMVGTEIHRLTQIYREFIPGFPNPARFDPEQARGRVLVFSPQARLPAGVQRCGPLRTAACTGWAIEPGARFRYGTDAAFPLSDHADFFELVEFVRRVSPRKVYTLHGYASAFAQTLRDLGWEAQALSEPDQLGLPFVWPDARRDLH